MPATSFQSPSARHTTFKCDKACYQEISEGVQAGIATSISCSQLALLLSSFRRPSMSCFKHRACSADHYSSDVSGRDFGKYAKKREHARLRALPEQLRGRRYQGPKANQ